MSGVQSWRSIPYCRRSLSLSPLLPFSFLSPCLPHLTFHTGHIMWILYLYIRCIWKEFFESPKLTLLRKSWNHTRLLKFVLYLHTFDSHDVGMFQLLLFHRKPFFQTISLCWIELWLNIIFWVQANFILISGMRNCIISLLFPYGLIILIFTLFGYFILFLICLFASFVALMS
jgi:hypothetical protein